MGPVPRANKGLEWRPIGLEWSLPMMRSFFIWAGLSLLVSVVAIWARWRAPMIDMGRYDTLFEEAAAPSPLHPALIKAVAWQESRFDAEARGGVGELGLMQLTDMAAYEWADHHGLVAFKPKHLLDARTNVMAGTFYLAKLVKRYQDLDRPLVYALADYNAGRKPVLGWMEGAGATNSQVFLEQMDYPSTHEYVLRVLKYAEDFRYDFEPGPQDPASEMIPEELRENPHSDRTPPAQSDESTP